MLKVSKVTGRAYHPDSAIYIANLRQAGAYMNNGGEQEVLDILYDPSKEFNKFIFVFEKNAVTRALYDKWNAHELEY